MKAGSRFVWCEEGAAYELVPVERLTRSYFLRRSFLQGGISLKYDRGTGVGGSVQLVLKTAVAAAAYSTLLPFFLMCGQHVFMKYLVKDCHHVGRLAAFVGIRIGRN
jgi:hypothetical protein